MIDAAYVLRRGLESARTKVPKVVRTIHSEINGASSARDPKSLASKLESDPNIIRAAASEICSELQRSLTLRGLRCWSQQNQDDESKLISLFCCCGWLCPHLRHDSEVSMFLNTAKADVYHLAARSIPSMLLLASFGEFADVLHLRGFLAQWERAQDSQRDGSIDMLNGLAAIDRGPLLFWLVNERVYFSSHPHCFTCPLHRALLLSFIATVCGTIRH